MPNYRYAIVSLLVLTGNLFATDEPIKKVLLIGIDGCRTDALMAARATNLQKLAA